MNITTNLSLGALAGKPLAPYYDLKGWAELTNQKTRRVTFQAEKGFLTTFKIGALRYVNTLLELKKMEAMAEVELSK